MSQFGQQQHLREGAILQRQTLPQPFADDRQDLRESPGLDVGIERVLLFAALATFSVLPEVFLDDQLRELESDFLLAVFLQFVERVDAAGSDDRTVLRLRRNIRSAQ